MTNRIELDRSILMTENDKAVGRNEPCPCGSGRKYKRCCGVSAAPKLSTPSFSPGAGGNPPFDPSVLENIDPQLMMQMSQAIQRLPHGQLQRLQSMMQKAMSGQDVSSEAEDFEKSLPSDFKSMMATWGGAFEQATGASDKSAPASPFQMPDLLPQLSSPESAGNQPEGEGMPESSMSEEQARQLVAQAAASGVISKEQAEELLKIQKSQSMPDSSTSDTTAGSSESEGSGLGRFWRNKAGKK